MRTKPTQQTQKLVHRIIRGKVEVAIWERSGQEGRFFEASFSRPYWTQDGSHAASGSFGLGQLADLVLAAAQASIWIEAQVRPDETEDFSQEAGERAEDEI